MSMDMCGKCGEVIDTDFHLDADLDGACICGECGAALEAVIEHLAAKVHEAYCANYLERKGHEYWTKGDYKLLDEETKEIDRATVRAVVKEMRNLGFFHKDEIIKVKIPETMEAT